MSAEQYAFPLSFAQERLWFLEQLQPGRQAYSICGAARLEGALSTAALDRALRTIVSRHETMRTTIAEVKGAPVQIVSEEARLVFPLVDLSSAEPVERKAQVRRLVSEEAARPFDLVRGPLFRPVLYRLSPLEHVLLVCIHHIVSDGWSVGILLSELKALYTAEAAPAPAELPELEVQYGDYVEWQRESLKGEALERELSYWRAKLAGLKPADLPSDRPRPAELSLTGRRHRFTLPARLTTALKERSGREGATLFMTLLAGFKVLLARYSGGRDLVVGSPIAGRDRPELEALIGFFVNTLVLRTDLGGDPTLREIVARVKETCLGAYANQQLPFGKLVEELHPQRDLSRNPLFQVMFALQNLPVERLELPEVTLTPLDLDRGAAQFDLSLLLSESEGALAGILEYSTDLFDPQTVERMATHLERVLETLVEAPDARLSALRLLTPEEERDLARWNATERAYPPGCVHERIVEVARAAPGRVAVECGGARLTYGELEERSRRLAVRLASQGVRPGVPVGIYVERSIEMVVGLLGILRAGGAYVPLDPGHPRERLASMVEDSGLRVVVTEAGLRPDLPAPDLVAVRLDADQDVAEGAPAPASPDDLAYLIFTSGSTGRPKGVAVSHRSLGNLLDSMAEEPGLGGSDVLLSVTTLSFDIAGLELFLPLLQGARLALATREEAADGRTLAALLDTSGATVMQATPATWRLMIESGWEGRPELKVLCGGEALPPELAGELARRCGALWNVYGPTETTIWSSCHRVQPGPGPVPIGAPIANTRLHVLDLDLNAVPVGVPGELYVGGAGLARGYWGRPDLTAERFVPDPFAAAAGSRMYRTGDLARRLRDGTIECLGRLDHQVKVRGFRIELGEIEVALRRYPGIEGAVVIAQSAAGGDRRLVACLTHGQQDQPNVTALRDHLKALLPVYMVPSSFAFLDRFPLTPNGKVDRNALARLDSGQTPGPTTFVPPRTPTEQFMAELWREALGIPRVGARDNFFDLGGHSLLAMRVLAAVEKKTGHRLHPRDIIFQSLEQLAAACDATLDPAAGGGERSLPGRLLGVLRGFIGGDPSSEAGAR